MVLKRYAMKQETNQLTSQESLALIGKVIEQTKLRYEENGNNITMWGLVLVLASLSSFTLSQIGHSDKTGIPWLVTIIPMFFYTMYTRAKKDRQAKPKRKAYSAPDYAWMMAGIFALVNGFLLRVDLGSAFLTTLFLPFCVAGLVTGIYLEHKTFIYLSIASSLLAFGSMAVPSEYQNLISAMMALVLFLIPGMILRADHKKRTVKP